MIKNKLLSVLALLAIPAMSSPLWYNGDLDAGGALSGVYPDGQVPGLDLYALYDDFQVAQGGWHVSGLFANYTNLANTTPTQAHWEIRSAMGDGDGGNLLAAGTSPVVSIDPTGRSVYGLGTNLEYTITIGAIDLNLAPGTYWMALAPIYDAPLSYILSDTLGANAMGGPGPGHGLRYYRYANGFTPYNYTADGPENYSYGVLGEALAVDAQSPEPSSMMLAAVGLVLVVLSLAMRGRAISSPVTQRS